MGIGLCPFHRRGILENGCIDFDVYIRQKWWVTSPMPSSLPSSPQTYLPNSSSKLSVRIYILPYGQALFRVMQRLPIGTPRYLPE